MPFGPLEDTVLTAETTTGSSSRFRPYASPSHHVVKSRYITSNDPRGYIPVYEYPLNGQWIMMDVDDGYVLWTGIWKALGNSKADIVKMVESQPDLASQIRRVRGGYLKIQGTWMPYEVALRLSRRVAWEIRHDLVPLFGPTFPSTCLSPDQAGYGQVIPNTGGRRRPRRSTNGQTSVFASSAATNGGTTGWAIVNYYPSSTPSRRVVDAQEEPPRSLSAAQPAGVTRSPSSRHTRYAPYSGSSTPPVERVPGSPSEAHLAPPLSPSPASSVGDAITLPPIHTPPSKHRSASFCGIALPPISSMANQKPHDSRAVLERLRAQDEDDVHSHAYLPQQIPYGNVKERRISLDEQMHQRSRALLASTPRSVAGSSWREERPHGYSSSTYESSSTSGSPFERSPISPKTPPHYHQLPPTSYKQLSGQYEQDPRCPEPQAHAW